MTKSAYPAINIGHFAVRKGLLIKNVQFISEVVRMAFPELQITDSQTLTVDASNIDSQHASNFYEENWDLHSYPLRTHQDIK